MSRAIGQVATSATTQVPIESTPYTEQTSGAQRSLKSSSASDAAAGTGVRTVQVTYFKLASDGTITGPFTEIVTLNGVTAVPMVATSVALIEKMVALTAGSGGVAAGAISMYANNDGTGTVIASIAAASVATLLGHHYVPTGAQCRITDLEAIGGDAAAALVDIACLGYPTGRVEQTVSGMYGTTSTLPRQAQFNDAPQTVFPGPCRLRLRVKPANGNAQTTYASFGYTETQYRSG